MTEEDLLIQELRRKTDSLQKIVDLLHKEINDRNVEIEKYKNQVAGLQGEIVRLRRMVEAEHGARKD